MVPSTNSFEFSQLYQMLWNAIDECISLRDCEIFSYLSDVDDPFTEEGSL